MNKVNKKNEKVSISKRIMAALIAMTYIGGLCPAAMFAESRQEVQISKTKIESKEEKSEALISVENGGTVVLGNAKIEIPAGALKEDTVISITRLKNVAEVGESLYNATAEFGGYRFLPAGTKFQKDVTITLPYSAELNAKPQSLDELYTYFYDVEKEQWIKLERLEVEKKSCLVKSLSTHFTDMINATLTLPESASPVDVNLNSIKNLEAAKPDTHLIKFNSPTANNLGDATFSFDIAIPSGRRGMEPKVSVSFSSGAGNGMMGKGFDINYGSSITTDTRKRLPNYDKEDTYMLDGILLGKVDSKISGNEIEYKAERESSFYQIIRYGAGTDNNWWEVTDKSGTKRIYGKDGNACVGTGKEIFTWNLTKVIDVYGNTIAYKYEKDSGYVYPSEIIYTGYKNDEGFYSVRFNYDEKDVSRDDVRTDARSRQIITCRKLLTSITTHYKNGTPIRMYKFEYTEGLAKEKMLTKLVVMNNADEGYEYSFAYTQPNRDENGNVVYFADEVLWGQGSSLNEAAGKSIGGNVHTSAGVGYGIALFDARVTGGITGSGSSSSSYTQEQLIDIDGDGKSERIHQYGGKLLIYKQTLLDGKRFESTPTSIDVASLVSNSFLMNNEQSSNSSFGWNIYGGAGTPYGLASVGYVHSVVEQKGMTKLYTGFYDMDGDGLVDIVTGTTDYLHNDSKNGQISFSHKKIINYPKTDIRKLSATEIDKYRQAYFIQRPFISWESLYDGQISFKNLSVKNNTFQVKTIYGDEEKFENEKIKVGQGDFVYFVPDVGNEPKLEDLEKEYGMEVSLEYETAKIFNRKLEFPVYFPDMYLSEVSPLLSGLYDYVQEEDEDGIEYQYYQLKNNFEEYLTKEIRVYLMNEGLFVPGLLTENIFAKMKDFVIKKLSESDEYDEEKKEESYLRFANTYIYSASDRLFHLVQEPNRNLFDNGIKGFINRSNLPELLVVYKQNGIDADITENTLVYKTASEGVYTEKRYTDDKYSLGASFVKNNNEYIYLGKIENYEIIVNKETLEIELPPDCNEKITVKELLEDRCVLDVGNGKYIITYDLSDCSLLADSVSNEEYMLMISEFEKNYPNNSIESDFWKFEEPVSFEDLISKLKKCNVLDKTQQKNFINYLYDKHEIIDEETEEVSIVYKRKEIKETEITKNEFKYAEKILKDAMYENIYSKDFPYYDDTGKLKKDYYFGKINESDYNKISSICLKNGIFKFNKINSSITYVLSGEYTITNGETELIAYEEDSDNKIIYRKQKLEFPDKTIVFNSKNDFSAESISETKKDLLNIYSRVEDGVEQQNISVSVKEFLYGGKNSWFYGIWAGSEDSKEHKFTETALHKIFAVENENEGNLSNSNNKVLSKSEIEALSEEKQKEVEDSPDQSDFTFGCSLPLAKDNELIGVESKYMKETVSDDGGQLKSDSKLILSTPKISSGKVQCNRFGGNVYYSIEGINEATINVSDSIQKTQTSGKDITSGPQVSVLGLSASTQTTNIGTGQMLQTLQDANGDRIPDVLKIVGTECHIYYGFVDTEGNINYPDTSEVISLINVLSSTHNESSSTGFSFSPTGAIQSIYSASGKQTGICITNGFGLSTFNGKNWNTTALLDINGDGIADYVDSGNVYLGKGNTYEQKFNFGWEELSYGSISGTSGSLNLGLLGKVLSSSSAGQDNIANVSAGMGGCMSTSSSIQTQMFVDVNGDGLIDVIRKASDNSEIDNTKYEVYYNTGSEISPDCDTVLIQNWKTGLLGNYVINNNAINENEISYDGNVAKLPEKMDVDIGSVSSDLNNLDCSISISNYISGDFDVNVSIQYPIFFGSIISTVNIGGGLNSGSTNTSATVKMMDLDGDGLVDHVLNISGGALYWKQNISGKYGQLERINLPQGGNIKIEYTPQYGTTENPNFKYVMSKVIINDGVDGKGNLPEVKQGKHFIETSYKYDGGYYDRELKEFLGFKNVITSTCDTVQTDEYYNREYYSKGCIKNTTLKDNKGNTLLVQNTTLKEAPYALIETEIIHNYENGKFVSISTKYDYDIYGNCKKLTQDFGDGKKLVADIMYDKIPEKYIMGLPFDIKVSGSEGALRHRWGRYDGNGQLIELRQYYNQNAYSLNTLLYDDYGNVKKVSDSRGATLEYKYDESQNMFLEEILQYGKDTEKYKSEIKYNYSVQTKSSETDCNGNYIKYEYDDWQRIKEVYTSYDKDGIPAVSYEYHTPDNSIKESAELWYAITNNKVAFKPSEQNTVIPVIQTVLQIDGLGRPVSTSKTGCVNGELGWNVSGVVEYDEKGRTIAEGMPQFVRGDLSVLLSTEQVMTELSTLYKYDAKDRQIEITLPDGSVQLTSYDIEANRTVIRSKDPNGKVSVQESDNCGNIVRVAKEDINGKQLTEVTYEYNEMGEMLKTFDAQKNAITVEYDILGRRTSLESKDSGRQEFFYDDCSNLIRETNSVLREQNKQIDYTYDNLNRLINIDYPGSEEDTIFVYGGISDSNINAVGKILSIRDASGTISYEYGQLGEVTKEIRVLKTHLNGKNATELAEMQYQSDYLGRMQWIIYPDGEKITYGYDAGGQVTSVEGSHYNQAFPYVTKILYDQYGQRTRIEYGNGTYTDYTYNPERRWLETVKTKNKYGQSYQNIRYDFDRVGNVRSYVNDCMDTVSGNYKTEQTYGYDDLYQLIHVTGNTEYYPAASAIPDYKSTYTQDFVFDDKGLGNMMSKVSKETVSPLKVIGDNLNYNIGYVYDENYAHRIVQAGNRYYKYDANGNIICEQDGSFDDSENDGSYYKVDQHSEDVYSTDNGWGLFRDESRDGGYQPRKYRRTYTWNSRNQLVSSVDANYSTSYVYGQDGQRSNKYTQGSETLYFNKMWTLHTDSGNSTYGGQYAKNVYLGETRIVTKLTRADQKTAHEEMYKQYFYHSDHLGSASMISDWEGKEYQRIEYTPYGETWVEKTSNSGSEFLPYRFTGKEVDQETGLYYYGARYLDPKYSMWISTDPALGEYIPEMGKGNSKNSANLPGMGGVYNHINFNLYHYAGNNPVRYLDPDGRETRTSEIKVLIDLLGTKPNKFISSDFILDFLNKLTYIGNDPQKIANENFELQKLAIDATTMIDSEIISLTKVTEKKGDQDLGAQFNYAKKRYFGLNTEVDDRNANRTVTQAKKVMVRIYYARNITSDGEESDIYKSFLDFNDDGNIDFIFWGKVNLDE